MEASGIQDECCAPSPHVMSVEQAEALTASIKALADPVRLRIFHHVAVSDSSVCFCHLPEAFGVSQPTLSHHLKKLTEAGLVNREMRGRWAHYTPRPEGLAALRGFLGELP
ncbi:MULTISPECIES: ArsR/SmtB family transcription factor [unclassified Luteococcus]|uniref:ArsR/SmtB family transcription factor n=1 Tax=unclassified Luteococcus TaxID=2639923 RepID=UPI00313AC99E